MYEEKILQQNLGFIRPKYTVMEGLKKKIAEIPRISSSFDLSFEYPRHETQAQDPRTGQTGIRRKIVIKKVQAQPKVKAIGQVYTSDTFGEDVLEMLEAEGVGQVDTHTIEISVWSPDSKDRDMLIDLIRIWMLELNRNAEETGLPFFYQRGIYGVEEVRHYDTIDRNNTTTAFHVGIIVYNMLCPFYGVHTDRFVKFKYDIINQIIDNTGGGVIGDGDGEPTTYPGEIIFVPDPIGNIPGTGGGGGSGGGSGGGIGSNDQQTPLVIPKYEELTPRIDIGGSYSGRDNDTVIIPGPNTEERTVQSVVPDTEE